MNLHCIRVAFLHVFKESNRRLAAHAGCSGHCFSRPISSTCRLHKQRKSKHDQTGEQSDDLSSTLKDAARSVAESLPGDAQKTESTLLQQLRAHATLAKGQKEGRETTPTISGPEMSLLSSMRVQQKGFPPGFMQPKRSTPKDTPEERKARLEKLTLFGGPSLGIFTKEPTDTTSVVEESKRKSLWDEIEAAKLDLHTMRPPENAFDEMIQMTKEGKLWTFPINNEAGMTEEQDIGFHEHIFFEHLISDFPHRGPIRIFMELVTTGLSKNPYLSVKQKHEHIDWFRQYFKGKEAVLEENLAEDGIMKEITDNQLQ